MKCFRNALQSCIFCLLPNADYATATAIKPDDPTATNDNVTGTNDDGGTAVNGDNSIATNDDDPNDEDATQLL